MRKLNKTCCYSTKYHEWLTELETANQNHREYDASFKYYWDVVMNLFHCQNGLCAYTEKRLCPEKYYNADKWAKGRYKRVNYVPTKPKIKGELEHFDTKLKPKKGWLWNNFFMVDSDVNSRAKGMMVVDPMLKPDNVDYDEFALFEYDSSMHIFKANTGLPKAKQNIINEFADAIMNFDPVIDERRTLITKILKLIDFGAENWDSLEIDEFPTALEMIRREKASI